MEEREMASSREDLRQAELAKAYVRVVDNLLVADGWSDGKVWGTYWVRPNGTHRRVRSAYLPDRATRAEAEADLAAWRRKRLPVTFQDRMRRAERYRAEAAVAERKSVDRRHGADYRAEMVEKVAELLALAEHELELGREQDPGGAAEWAAR